MTYSMVESREELYFYAPLLAHARFYATKGACGSVPWGDEKAFKWDGWNSKRKSDDFLFRYKTPMSRIFVFVRWLGGFPTVSDLVSKMAQPIIVVMIHMAWGRMTTRSTPMIRKINTFDKKVHKVILLRTRLLTFTHTHMHFASFDLHREAGRAIPKGWKILFDRWNSQSHWWACYTSESWS